MRFVLALAALALLSPAAHADPAPTVKIRIVNKTDKPVKFDIGQDPNKSDWASMEQADGTIPPGEKRVADTGVRCDNPGPLGAVYAQMIWSETRYIGCAFTTYTPSGSVPICGVPGEANQLTCAHSNGGKAVVKTIREDLVVVEVRPQ